MTAPTITTRTTPQTQSREDSSGSVSIPHGHESIEPRTTRAVGDQIPAAEAVRQSKPTSCTPRLLDPTLSLLADLVNDIEATRVALGNRLEQASRRKADKDGVQRGLGLPDDHPVVRVLRLSEAAFSEQEAVAVKELERALRAHPLGGWVKAQQGVGLKQAARLLAAINDPYWNDLHNRPRTVSELWAYCGLHVLPDGTSARHRKGQRSNWSTDAKTRVYLIAANTIKYTGKVEASGRIKRRSPYRDIYEQRRAWTWVTHPDWTDGHSHNDALRVVSKEILKDLWREAARIHQG